MPEDFSELQTLLRLKRHETPPSDYLEGFLTEFHRRQRAELLRRPLWRIALDRLENLIPTLPALPVPNLAYAGVGAVALAAAVGMFSRYPASTLPVVASGVPAATLSTVASSRPAASVMSVAPLAAVRIAPDLDDVPFNGANAFPAFAVPSARSVTVSSDRPRYLLDTRPVRYEPRSTSF